MKQHRAGKIIKRTVLIVMSVLLLLILGLIINNRICYLKAGKVDTKQEMLTADELNDVINIYEYLKENGEELIEGFDGTGLDLILYNESYEFLLTDQQSESGWEYITKDEITGRNIFRRNAVNPQAFAVWVNTRYAGSFATHDYYNKSILEQVPIFYPPQLLSADKEYYTAIVIHELLHAYQGNIDRQRLDRDEHYHNVCQEHTESEFKASLSEEASYLELAIKADSKEEAAKEVNKFLTARKLRREKTKMTAMEIQQEDELEWLEGCARYVEMNVAKASKSPVAKNLDQITKRAGYDSDERYYALGMAQAMLLNKYMENWEQNVFQNGMTLTNCLEIIFE